MFNDKEHEKLFSRVEHFLYENGWKVARLGIESIPHLPDAVKFGETILVRQLRGRCDALAYHEPTLSFFIFDVKRPVSKQYPDPCVEILPLCHHIKNNDGCLYVVEHSFRGKDFAFGFECGDAVLMAKKFWIPRKYYRGGSVDTWVDRADGSAPDTIAQYRELIGEAFPWVQVAPVSPIIELDNVPRKYSGDPYVTLSCDRTKELPHWQIVLKSRMDKCVADGTHVLERRHR